MRQEPSHWSERAKADLPPLPSPRSGRSGGRPPRRKAFFGNNPTKILVIAAVCVFCLGALGGGLAWYFAARGGGSGATDATAVVSTSSADTITGSTATTTSTPTSSSTSSSASSSTSDGAASTTSLPGAAPSTTQSGSSPNPTVPPGWVAFQDSRLAFSLHYPETWVEFPLEQASELTGPPTLGLAVGDPEGTKFGTTPANYIFFGAYEDPSMSAPPAAEALEDWAAMTESEWPEPLTTIEQTTAFRVNGLDTAAKLYSTEVQGRPLTMRVCFVSAGTVMYIFVFRAEEQLWATEKVYFDAVLNSFTVVVNQ
jgi:hypothetical protein